jgi:hypothetical protein
MRQDVRPSCGLVARAVIELLPHAWSPAHHTQGLQGLTGLIPACLSCDAFPHLTYLSLANTTYRDCDIDCEHGEVVAGGSSDDGFEGGGGSTGQLSAPSAAATATAATTTSGSPPLHTLKLCINYRPSVRLVELVVEALARLPPTLRVLAMNTSASKQQCAQDICHCFESLGRVAPQHLHTLSLPGHDLNDDDVKALLKLPALVRLEAASVNLSVNHNAAAASCTWREIILDDSSRNDEGPGTHITSLARLPLRDAVQGGGGVVKLRALACFRNTSEAVTSAVQHLLSLQGWTFGALNAADVEELPARFEAGRLELWLCGNDMDVAAAVMPLVVTMRDVTCLWVGKQECETWISAEEYLRVLSVLTDASAAAPTTSPTRHGEALFWVTCFGGGMTIGILMMRARDNCSSCKIRRVRSCCRR